jgi:hypothetical protein
MMDLSHDDQGLLVIQEPIYLWWTGWDRAKGRKHPASYYMPEIWRCHAHPDWQGEDIPQSRIAEWDASGEFQERPGGPRAIWEHESVQAHVLLHRRSRDI